MALLHIVTTTVLATALAVAGAAVDSGRINDPTPAERVYADAPQGVDPMVTGPVSAAYRERQAQNDCGRAVWPDVPLACYPQ